MRRNTMKKTMKRYTAFVPKTLHATQDLTKKTARHVTYFLSHLTKTMKRNAKKIDKKVASTIRSIGKKRSRK